MCAANGTSGDRFPDERGVHEWVNHWRESAPYDCLGSEDQWLTDLDEVIVAAGGKPSGGESRRVSSRWLSNADQLVRAGLAGDGKLNE